MQSNSVSHLQNQRGNEEPLELVRDEILVFAKKEGLEIFYSDSKKTEYPVPEIYWDNSRDWKLFFSLAKSQDVNLLVTEERRIDAEFSDAIARIEAKNREDLTSEEAKFLASVERLSKYKEKVGSLKVSWSKDLTTYSLCLTTEWFDEIEALLPAHLKIEHNKVENFTVYDSSLSRSRSVESPIPKDLENRSVDELAQEMLEFVNKEYGNDLNRISYASRNMFWESKGVHPSETDPKGTFMIEKVNERAQAMLQKQSTNKEKDRMAVLIQSCVKWCKDNGLTKVTRGKLKGFLLDRGNSSSNEVIDILWDKVNAQLKDKN